MTTDPQHHTHKYLKCPFKKVFSEWMMSVLSKYHDVFNVWRGWLFKLFSFFFFEMTLCSSYLGIKKRNFVWRSLFAMVVIGKIIPAIQYKSLYYIDKWLWKKKTTIFVVLSIFFYFSFFERKVHVYTTNSFFFAHWKMITFFLIFIVPKEYTYGWIRRRIFNLWHTQNNILSLVCFFCVLCMVTCYMAFISGMYYVFRVFL